MSVFKKQATLDKLIETAVFVIGILCQSEAALKAKKQDETYRAEIREEMLYLAKRLNDSGLAKKFRLVLVYIPLADKKGLVTAFDARLKALQ